MTVSAVQEAGCIPETVIGPGVSSHCLAEDFIPQQLLQVLGG